MPILLATWETLSDADRAEVAIAVSKSLPLQFQFVGIRRSALAGQESSLAIFKHDESEFVLEPGHTADLGYSWVQPFTLTPDEYASWQETADEYEIELTFDEYLEEILTEPRTVTIPAFLLEIHATDLGKRPLPGRFGANELAPTRHSDAINQLDAQGFRLPTSDEWEYACGGGSRTLFRWGDHCPSDRCPTDGNDWQLHCQPNAFGLHIAQHPYNWEFVAEIGIMRGGDGGATICGGMGHMISWLTLATAHALLFEDAARDEPVHGVHVRRVLTVEP